MDLDLALFPDAEEFFEQYKFHRIQFIYRVDVPLSKKNDAFALCKLVASAVQSKLPKNRAWRVMAYGLNKVGVDVIVVSELNQFSPSLMHLVYLN